MLKITGVVSNSISGKVALYIVVFHMSKEKAWLGPPKKEKKRVE